MVSNNKTTFLGEDSGLKCYFVTANK